jgi:hypothetical protein
MALQDATKFFGASTRTALLQAFDTLLCNQQPFTPLGIQHLFCLKLYIVVS